MASPSITSRNEAVRQARRDLAAALRMADRLGFSEGVCNHFSFAVPGADGLFLINSAAPALVGSHRVQPAAGG